MTGGVVLDGGYNLDFIDAKTGAGLGGGYGGSSSGEFQRPPSVAYGLAYVSDIEHSVYAFNSTGCGSPMVCTPIWKFSSSGQFNDFNGTPAAVNNVVYVAAADGKLYALNATTGALLWAGLLPAGESPGTVSVAGGVAYVTALNPHTGLDGALYAFNATGCGAATCNPLWSTGPLALDLHGPVVANGSVFIGSYDGKLYAFTAAGCGTTNCSPVWNATIGGIIPTAPAAANGVVYIGSTNSASAPQTGHVYAFNANGCGSATCSSLWSFDTHGPVTASPVIVNGALYFAGYNSQQPPSVDTLYCLRIPSGTGQPTPVGTVIAPKSIKR